MGVLTKRQRQRVDRRRLERALCALVDHEGLVTDALVEAPGVQGQRSDFHNVCAALRAIVDEGYDNE